jgi:hypothetical protein
MTPPGSASASKPCSYVDAVAEDVIPIDNNITDINADAELDAFLRRYTSVAIDHAALNIDGATHSVDDANELHQQPISGGLNNSAAMFRDLGVYEFLAMCFELAQRAFLIGTH